MIYTIINLSLGGNEEISTTVPTRFSQQKETSDFPRVPPKLIKKAASNNAKTKQLSKVKNSASHCCDVQMVLNDMKSKNLKC